ncbi:FAD-dependent oxidoreductase [Nocardia beijingensis]|uniref:NAD(P)/FAD-dependent oxidoreductase n=1 Tax=Nocardia beijingensis TaxID=95162 RepID=UPI00344D0527
MTGRDVQLAVIGGGAAALWLTRLAAGAGLRTALLTAGPLGSHASTRNQSWLHSGGFYAAYGAWGLARQCADGSADVRALARDVPELLARPSRGVFLAADPDHAASVFARLSTAGIEHRPLSEDRWARPGFDVADCAVDTCLLLEVLLDDSIRRGATVVPGLLDDPPTRIGERWLLRAGDVEIQARYVVLALGAGLPRYLRAWRLNEYAPDYVVTRTRVLVLPNLMIEKPIIPLFDAGPTVVPVWHRGRHHGATICLPFDNTTADEETDERSEIGSLLDKCVERLPDLASWLTSAVRADGALYRCEKLLVAGQYDGTEASRSYRVDQLSEGLVAFYAGKFTTASVGAREVLRALLKCISPDRVDTSCGELLGELSIAPRAAIEAGLSREIERSQ